MTYFLPEARAEFLEAIAYYEAQAPGLGADFVNAVEVAIRILLAFPEAGPVVASTGLRRMLVSRFPGEGGERMPSAASPLVNTGALEPLFALWEEPSGHRVHDASELGGVFRLGTLARLAAEPA